MAAHIKQRKDRGSIFYLVDGPIMRSLGTTKKGLAQHRLEQYIQGKYGLKPTPTVQEFYDSWIAGKVEPLYRRSRIKSYREHFGKYILPQLGSRRLSAIGLTDLNEFRVSMMRQGVSVRTCQNIIVGTLRAMYRDARAEIDALKGKDPFIDMRWPRRERQRPESFTADEKARILAYFRQHEPFYYPWVLLHFSTGLRPSEACGLRLSDVNAERCEISITKSRNLGADNATKTSRSHRTIRVPVEVIDALLTLPSWSLGTDFLFVNLHAGPLDASGWAWDHWHRALKACGVRFRKFYSCRHTFITEQVRRGEVVKAIADYCGTSIQMIEANYCDTLTLSDLTVFKPDAGKYAKSQGSTADHISTLRTALKKLEVLSMRELKKSQRPKSA